jgi:hypothetical protein
MAMILIPLSLLVGCHTSKVSKSAVSGTLTYKGRPVNGGAIVLFSSGSEVTVPLDQDGRFRSADIPVGDYKVVIEPSEGIVGPPGENMPAKMKEKLKNANMSQPPTIPIPEKYKNKETTDLTLTINKNGETNVNLELKD